MQSFPNPLTLQPEQSGGVGPTSGTALPLERYDTRSWTRSGLLYYPILLGAEKRNFTFISPLTTQHADHSFSPALIYNGTNGGSLADHEGEGQYSRVSKWRSGVIL